MDQMNSVINLDQDSKFVYLLVSQVNKILYVEVLLQNSKNYVENTKKKLLNVLLDIMIIVEIITLGQLYKNSEPNS